MIVHLTQNSSLSREPSAIIISQACNLYKINHAFVFYSVANSEPFNAPQSRKTRGLFHSIYTEFTVRVRDEKLPRGEKV